MVMVVDMQFGLKVNVNPIMKVLVAGNVWLCIIQTVNQDMNQLVAMFVHQHAQVVC